MRGCLKEFSSVTDCLANENCELCEEDYCNKREQVEEFCYQCDSKNVADCRTGAAAVKKCVDITFDKSGCYHFDNGKLTE
jgi:primosomal protein N'